MGYCTNMPFMMKHFCHRLPIRQRSHEFHVTVPGVSMGGTLASAAAVLSSPRGSGGQRGLAVVPGVGTWSAETFIRGVLRKRIDWGALAAADAEGGRRRGTGQVEEDKEEEAVDALAVVLRRFSIKSMLGDDGERGSEPQLGVVVQVSAKGAGPYSCSCHELHLFWLFFYRIELSCSSPRSISSCSLINPSSHDMRIVCDFPS